MSNRSRKCSESEITKLLNSNTVQIRVPIVKLTRIVLHNENTKEDLISTKTCNNKLPPKNNTEEEKTSFKMKLRRSTEQSNYKIDNSFNYESKQRSVKNKKENNDPLQVDTYDKQPERIMERHRSRPTRFSDYECAISPQITSPRAKNRKNIKYSEKQLLNTPLSHVADVDESSTKIPQSNKRNYTLTKEFESINSRCPKTMRNALSESLSATETKVAITSENIIDTPRKSVKRLSRTRFITNDMDENHVPFEDRDKINIERKVAKIVQNHEKEDKNNVCNSTIGVLKNEKNENVRTLERKIGDNEEKTEMNVLKDTLYTPKSRAIRKYSSLTPSMEKRTTSLVKPATPLQQARSKLHVSTVPKSLPCREEEFNNIFTFLHGKLLDKCGGCIYISGVPGTGKTATVNEVIRCLKRSVEKGQLDDFDFLEINGMKLTEPRQAYVQILKQLTGTTYTWEKAYRDLDKRFTTTNSKRQMTLLLVDELDLLCTKRQDVVYNLLDWPMKASAQLVVITIANTMDLPERILMGRVTSRLGLTRLTFQPYNHKQLQEIVLTRLKDYGAFRNEAVQLVARKVAAVSGDARRALDICRRATEIAELYGRETVSMEDVNEALLEMIASAKVQAIKHCSQLEQLFLQAVCAEVTRTGLEEASFKNVYNQLDSLCSFEGIKPPTITGTLAICERLTASRLLICEHTKMDIHRRILLNVSSDDVHFALQQIDFN